MSATATTPQITAEFAATTRDYVLAACEREAQTTRRVIAAIPEDKKSYQVDAKAKSADELAWHIAFNDVNMLESIARLSFMPLDEETGTESKLHPATIAEIVKWHEANLPKAMAKVQAMTPQQLMTPVDFFGSFNLPAFMYLEFWKVHMIHHRGWLASYLRPMGSKCPSVYGGSADEPWNG
jgi:uncharacterized damage-inducible protein DinB